jgi:hypothetical protein
LTPETPANLNLNKMKSIVAIGLLAAIVLVEAQQPAGQPLPVQPSAGQPQPFRPIQPQLAPQPQQQQQQQPQQRLPQQQAPVQQVPVQRPAQPQVAPVQPQVAPVQPQVAPVRPVQPVLAGQQQATGRSAEPKQVCADLESRINARCLKAADKKKCHDCIQDKLDCPAK